MKSSFAIFKESIAIYRNNFLMFSSVVTLYFLATLIISPTESSNLSYDEIKLSILMIPLTAWQSLALLHVTKNQKIRTEPLKPYIKTVDQIIPLSIIYVLMTLAVAGGFILLIVPGIILSIYTSFSLYIYFFEGLKRFDALSRSWGYVYGNFFNIMWKSLLPTIILFFVAWIAGQVSTKIFPESLSQTISDFFIELLMSPIYLIYFYLVYLELVKLDKSKVNIDKKVTYKRKIKLKIISTIGLLALLSFIFWGLTKSPNYFSYKATKMQEMNIIKADEQYSNSRQIRIKIDGEYIGN